MNQGPKFKPGQGVVVVNVRSASAVGYLGVPMHIEDYVKNPNVLRVTKDGEYLYPCTSDNGYFSWWYEDELKS